MDNLQYISFPMTLSLTADSRPWSFQPSTPYLGSLSQTPILILHAGVQLLTEPSRQIQDADQVLNVGQVAQAVGCASPPSRGATAESNNPQ